MQNQVQVFLLPVTFKSDETTSHKHSLASESFQLATSEVAFFETNFFRIASISEAETSMSGKAECFLALGEDKKVSFLD